MGAENTVRYLAPLRPLPPLTAALYIESRCKQETLRDAYLFGALHALLRMKPGEYYPNYPSYSTFCAGVDISAKPRREASYQDIMKGILERLSSPKEE